MSDSAASISNSESSANKAENLNTNNSNNNNNNSSSSNNKNDESVNEIVVEAKEEQLSRKKKFFEGHVKWFSKRSGYGFICRDGTTDELFVHLRSLSRSRRWPHRRIMIRTGDKVKFMIRECEKGFEAFSVRLIRPAYLEETVLSIKVPSAPKPVEIVEENNNNNESTSPVRNERKVNFLPNSRNNTRYTSSRPTITTTGNTSVLKMSEAVLVNMLKYIDSKALKGGGSFDRLKHASPINYKLQKINIPYREIKNSYQDLFTRGVRVISLVLSNNGKEISAHILTGKEGGVNNKQQQTKPIHFSSNHNHNSTKIERKITKFNLKQQATEAISK